MKFFCMPLLLLLFSCAGDVEKSGCDCLADRHASYFKGELTNEEGEPEVFVYTSKVLSCKKVDENLVYTIEYTEKNEAGEVKDISTEREIKHYMKVMEYCTKDY